MNIYLVYVPNKMYVKYYQNSEMLNSKRYDYAYPLLINENNNFESMKPVSRKGRKGGATVEREGSYQFILNMPKDLLKLVSSSSIKATK